MRNGILGERERMMQIKIPELLDISACAKVYMSAYEGEPWNEVYEVVEVEKYISAYMNSDTKCCFVLVDGEKIVGVALGFIVPSIDGPFFRVEDFCVGASMQRNGYGSVFMDLLSKEVANMGCDSVLLGTQKGFPSHLFYVKNGFLEVESVLLYKEIGEK